MAKDVCIICGVETPYDFETHIDMRIGYIQGIGQLCKACYNKGSERVNTLIPNSIIEDTPNDQELGNKVRNIYHQNK
jgi:hypothetical protein